MFYSILGLSIEAKLTQEEHDAIHSIVSKPPAIVIFGQDNYTKSYVANELFQKAILPMPCDCDISLIDARWRQVHFTYNARTSISLSLPGSYELVDNDLVGYKKPWKTIPIQDLLVKNTKKRTEKDYARETANLEVHLACPLLKDGGEVILSESNSYASLLEIYEKASQFNNPVPVYPVTGERLSEAVS